MIIDISKLILNMEDVLEIKREVNIPPEYIVSSSIRRLDSVNFSGSIVKLIDDSLELDGIVKGTMILPDDITLEDVDYSFESKLEENFSEFGDSSEKMLNFSQNILDITDILWQNILVEIPSKVHSTKNENVSMKGDGWRVITEEEFLKEQSSNNPFTELKQMIEESEDR